jgi:two-component system cell cycle response regulator
MSPARCLPRVNKFNRMPVTLWDPSTIAFEQSELTLFQSLDGPERQRCCLVVYSGPDLGRQILLDEGLCTLGRSATTQLQIGGPGISRLHAEICVSGSSATLRDLGSANGSFVGDTRLTDQPQRLKDGDLLRLGSVALKFYAHQSLDAALHDRVMRLATVDAGTGLFNRRYLMDALQRACRSARQTGRPLCLVMLDLDHFKRVNDGHGHAAGDLVLRECAAVASLVVGQSGVLGRIGGEEFLLLLPNTGLAAALALAEQLRAAVAGHGFELPAAEASAVSGRGRVLHRQTVSVGVAAWIDAMTEPSQLMAAADRGLYLSKQGGRNRVSS